MGFVPPRWAIVLLVAAVAIPAAVWAQEGDTQYRSVQEVKCWSCHSTDSYKDFPPLRNFFAIIPPADVTTNPGEPFTYVVQVQNTWGADMKFLRPTMDLTNASSLAFVSQAPPVQETIPGVITVNQASPQGPQRNNHTIDMPVGETRIKIVLTPADVSPTGPDLKLRIIAPTGKVLVIDNGTSTGTISSGRGATETWEITTRQEFVEFGYGNWTIEVEATILPEDPTLLPGASLPAQQFAYTLQVDASADAIEDRILSIPLGGDPLKPGKSRAFVFDMVALGEPAPGETVQLWVDAWSYYKHTDAGNQINNDDNVTREFLPLITVGPGISLKAETATAILLPGVQNGATLATISEVVGYAAAFLLISSVWTGGMFGKASRRQLNTVFGSAKRRVAFHNFLSYGIILAASIHTVLFIIETLYYWTVGVIWGGVAILAMLGLGLTGALQVQMIRKWSYGFWRWSHYGLAVAAILFTLLHGLFDGVHFAEFREPFGWTDPLDPRDVAA